MRRLTASKAALGLKCSYWRREDVPLMKDEPGLAALEGTYIHWCLERAIRVRTGGTVPPVQTESGLPFESAQRCAEKLIHGYKWIHANHRIGWRPEVAFAYSPATDFGRELDQTHQRDYSHADPDDICCQADVVSMGQDQDGAYCEVIDFKSGQESDAVWPQLAVAALAWSAVTGVRRVKCRAVYLRDDGVHESAAMWLERPELECWMDRFRKAQGSDEATPTPGPHCHDYWCPARHQCPATVSSLASVSGLPVVDVQRLAADAIVTAEDAGKAYVTLRVIKDAVKAVEDRIKSVVETRGAAPTVDGKEIRLTERSRESFSKDRIPWIQRDEVVDMLRGCGALKTSTWQELREGKRTK